MTRIRTIKPEFWTDEKVVELSAFARLLFIGIWNFCDDEGRMVYSPKRLKLQIFPADALDVAALFDELLAAGLVQVYDADGTSYLVVRGFVKHQKIDKRSPSRLPAPPADAPTCVASDSSGCHRLPPTFAEFPQIPPSPADYPRIPPPEGKGREGNGKEGKGSEANASGTAKGELSTTTPVLSQSSSPAAMGKDDLWAAGKALLEEAGMPARQCGSFVGRLAREHGRDVAMEAVRVAVLERPADPIGYLQATCLRLTGLRASQSPWYASEQGVLAKGRELSLSALPGESLQAFKARIEASLVRARDPPEDTRTQRSQMLKASLKRCDA